MRILTKEESQYIDRMAPEKYGIPLGYLMENAGSDVAQVLADHYKGAKFILFLSGNGNNGADGLVAARHLMELEIPVCIYLFGIGIAIKTVLASPDFQDYYFLNECVFLLIKEPGMEEIKENKKEEAKRNYQ